MAPCVSISIRIVALWVLCIFMHATTMSFVAASKSSALELEAKAILESGWWSEYSNDTSSLCRWDGIICNDVGSVAKIDLAWFRLGYKISKFNFSSFPNLFSLNLSYTQLSGRIPLEIGTLSKLTYLDLSHNNLIGDLPLSLAKLTQLVTFNISSNLISGSISKELGNLKNLLVLSLSNNRFSGPIPPTLGLLTNLSNLDLSFNEINSSIPSEIGLLKNLLNLDLQQNKLIGPIPSSLGHLTNLAFLSLSSNQINGSIPPEIGNLKNLSYLFLNNNNITGEIPIELGDSHCIEILDLSYNYLIGNIPDFSNSIKEINFSYNSLHGQIPNGYLGHTTYIFIRNKDLYGDIKGFPPSLPSSPNNNRSIFQQIKFSVPLASLPGFLILGCFFLFRCWTRKPKSEQSGETKNGDLFSIWNYDGKIAYEDIIEATENFNIRYCIGTGSYGNVYKAQLPNGKVVALKKLHRLEAEDPIFDKSFKNEVKMLTEIRHRNIVKLYGYCLHKRCMFLVYEYMEMGSLFFVLSNDFDAVELDWMKRMNIIKSIAHALSYMHHECVQVIVHRDISSKNILLNSKLEAFVADFGMARFLDPNSSNQTLLAGTYGYVAPGKLLFSKYTLITY